MLLELCADYSCVFLLSWLVPALCKVAWGLLWFTPVGSGPWGAVCHLAMAGTGLVPATPCPHPAKALWAGGCGSCISWIKAQQVPSRWGAPSGELAEPFLFMLYGVQRRTEPADFLQIIPHPRSDKLGCCSAKPCNLKDRRKELWLKSVGFIKDLL